MKTEQTPSWKNRVVVCLPIAAVLTFMYIVFGLLEVVLNNAKDFSFTFAQALLPLLAVWLAATLVLSALMACFRGLGLRIVTGVVTGVTVCSYIQNLLLNLDLGLLEGEEIDWSAYGSHGLYNLLIWAAILIAVLVCAVLLKKYWLTAARAVCALLLVMQAVALGVSAVTTLQSVGTDETKRYALDGGEQFSVSAQGNVIVFVLDYCANTYWDETVSAYPEVGEWFNDFTYYSNCDPTYIGTFPSMTHMLTGYAFDTTVTIDQWFSDAWGSDSSEAFYSALAQNGYSLRLYTTAPKNMGLMYAMNKVDNLVDKEASGTVSTVHYDKLLTKSLAMAAYRYLPHELKKNFSLSSTDFAGIVTSQALGSEVVLNKHRFYQELTGSGLKVEQDDGKLLIVQHLRGTHAPYTLSENAEYLPGATMTQTARGNFLIVKEYLDQMKALGLYDDATIIITSDHGDKENNMQVIYFIKQPGESHDEMEENEAPISHLDFQGTLLQAVGADASALGRTTIYDWSEDDERERTVMRNAMDKNYPKVQKYGSTSTGTHTAMYFYTYEGNLKDLRKQVKRGPTEIRPLTESFN